MGRKKRFTAQQVADALTATRGMVYLAADRLECSHTTVDRYVNQYASVREAKERQRGKFKDIAEVKLIDAVIAGEAWAVKFALQMLGSDRGYAPRQEHEISGKGKDGAIVVDDTRAEYHSRALASLAATIGGLVADQRDERDGAMDATEPTAVVGGGEPG